MKFLIGFAFWSLSLAASAVSAAEVSSVRITLARVHEGLAVSPTVFKLEKRGAAFKCSTKSVPAHAVKVKGLTSLAAPFTNQKVFRDCSQILTWDRNQICYKRGENMMIDDLIDACVSI